MRYLLTILAAVKAPLSAGVDLENVAANAKTGGITTSIVAPNKGQTNQTLEVKKINTTPTPPKVPILPKPAAVVKETTTVVPTQIKQAPTASKGPSEYGDWNQWDESRALSPGNLTGTNASIFEVVGVLGQKYIPEAIKNTARPNNIGLGTWNKYLDAEVLTATSKFSTVTKVAKGAGYIAVGVDVGLGIYDNVQIGMPTKRVVSDAVVDTAFGGGGLVTSMSVGAGLGTIGCPVAGTVIGGSAAGILYMVGTELWKPGGPSVKDRAKEELYNTIK